jgi:hypothetical protein
VLQGLASHGLDLLNLRHCALSSDDEIELKRFRAVVL